MLRCVESSLEPGCKIIPRLLFKHRVPRAVPFQTHLSCSTSRVTSHQAQPGHRSRCHRDTARGVWQQVSPLDPRQLQQVGMGTGMGMGQPWAAGPC